MKAVGIRELKNRLSQYLRYVRAGETVLVTDRGEVIAEIFPPGQVNSVERMTQRYPEAFDGISPGLLALAREHGAKLPTRKNDPSLYPTLPAVMSSEEIAKLLDETRGGH